MVAGQKRRVLTTDDLLRRQEEPANKKLKISPLGLDDSDDASSELDEEVSEELANNGLRWEEGRSRRNPGDKENSDALLDGEEEPLTSGESDSEISFALEGRNSIDLQRVKTKTISQRLPKPTTTTFASLDISAPLQASLTAMSIRTPTEVQAACIPPLLAGQSAEIVFNVHA